MKSSAMMLKSDSAGSRPEPEQDIFDGSRTAHLPRAFSVIFRNNRIRFFRHAVPVAVDHVVSFFNELSGPVPLSSCCPVFNRSLDFLLSLVFSRTRTIVRFFGDTCIFLCMQPFLCQLTILGFLPYNATGPKCDQYLQYLDKYAMHGPSAVHLLQNNHLEP